jgi:hypothetical protein
LDEPRLRGKDLLAEAVASGFAIVGSSDLRDYRAQPGNWDVWVNQLGKSILLSVLITRFCPPTSAK